MAKHLDFETRLFRDQQREPSYVSRPRPIIPLAFAGAVRSYIERSHPVSRCSCCEKPTAGLRCKECQAIDARPVTCGCGWLGAGVACPGHDDEVAA